MAAERDAVQVVLAALDEGLGHAVGDQQRAERRVAARQALRARDQVGLVAVALAAEPLAEPAEAADHLVGDLQDAVGVADLAHAAVVLRMRRERAARVLDGLHDHHGDGLGPLLLDRLGDLVGARERALAGLRAVLAAVAVRVGDVADAVDERLERRADRRDARDRERAHGRAVVGDLARDDLAPHRLAVGRVVLARQLPGRLDRLGAAGDEERAVDAGRREIGEPGGELGRGRVRERPVRVVRQLAASARARPGRAPRRTSSRSAR